MTKKVNIQELLNGPIIDTNFVFPLDTTKGLTAKNDSSTKKLFNSRKKYKKYINEDNMPIEQKNKQGGVQKNYLDTWYKDPFYGKTDLFGNLVEIDLTKNTLKDIGDGLRMVNFAADAFKSFSEDYNNRRKISKDSQYLIRVEPVRAYSSMVDRFNLYLDSLYEAFFNDVLSTKIYSPEIKSLHDFANILKNYILTTGNPFTYTGFCESTEANFYYSGLVVDIYDGDPSDDFLKGNFMKDKNYPVLHYLSKMYGFKIDPNVPWRLIADINSDRMLNNWIPKYVKLPKDKDWTAIAKTYRSIYKTIYVDDLLALTYQIVVNYYNRFINKFPHYGKYTKAEKYEDKQKNVLFIKNTRAQVPPITYSDYTIDLYIDLRNIETKLSVDSKKIKRLKKRSKNLYKSQVAVKNNLAKSVLEREFVNDLTVDFIEHNFVLLPFRNKKYLTPTKKEYIFSLNVKTKK